MKLPLVALLAAFSPAAFAAGDDVPSCQMSAQPQSCKQNNGTAYQTANQAKSMYEQGCQEATKSLQNLNQQKQQIASRCGASGKAKSQGVSGKATGEGVGAHNEMQDLGGQNSALTKDCAKQMAGVSDRLKKLAGKLGEKAEKLEQAKSQGGGSVQAGCEGARSANDGVIDQGRDGFKRLQQSAESSAQDADQKKGTYDKATKALDGVQGKNENKGDSYQSDKSQADAAKKSTGKDESAGKKGGDPAGQGGGSGEGSGDKSGDQSSGQQQGQGQGEQKKQEGGGGSGSGGGGGQPQQQQQPQQDNSAQQAAAQRKAEEEKKAKEEELRKQAEEEAKKKAAAERQKAIDLNNAGNSGTGVNIQK